jgi:hypothetical protein
MILDKSSIKVLEYKTSAKFLAEAILSPGKRDEYFISIE